jgi:hypothetical protein
MAVLETASENVVERWAARVSALLDRGVERASAERIALQEMQKDNEIDALWEALGGELPETKGRAN